MASSSERHASAPAGDLLDEAQLTPVQKTPVYVQVIHRLQRLVSMGLVVPGGRLPPERELAERLEVSRTSIRQALAALRVAGVVEIRHGSGVYLKTDPTAIERVAAMLADRDRDLPHMIETRQVLEVQIAGLAAQRRVPADVRAMVRAVRRMEAEVAQGELGGSADQELHMSIWRAARNDILVEVMTTLAPRIARLREESLAQPGRPVRSLAAHRRIVDAISEGDPVKARAAMESHIREVGQTLLVHRGSTSNGARPKLTRH